MRERRGGVTEDGWDNPPKMSDSGHKHEADEVSSENIPLTELFTAVVQPGTRGLAAIEEAFGPEYIQDDGTLDRAKLGDLIFNDAAARKRLNQITHPGTVRAIVVL